MTVTKPLTLAEALTLLQAALPDVRKGNTAKVQTKQGREYTYTYADLADVTRAIMPKLTELGLSFSAKPTLTDSGRFVLRYVLRHTSGEDDGGDYPLPDPVTASAQEIGSAITYSRRYALTAVTGMTPDDDDDGAAASARRRASSSNAEHEDEPPPLAQPAQLRARIAKLGEAKSKTHAEVAEDFAAWSLGAAIGAADVELLAKYINAINAGEALNA